MHKGQVYDVTHCYNLGKKCVPPYVIGAFVHIIKRVVVSFLLEEHNRNNRLA